MEFLGMFCETLVNSGFFRYFSLIVFTWGLLIGIRFVLRFLNDVAWHAPIEDVEEIKEECEHIECLEDDCKYFDDDSRYDYYERWLNDRHKNDSEV